MFAGIELSTESMALISLIVSGLIGAIIKLFLMVIANKDAALLAQKDASIAALLEMTTQRNIYKDMAFDAINTLEIKINELRQIKGKKPFNVIAAVVPEHNSPVTLKQFETAEMQTLRARMTAAVLDLEMPPRIIESTVEELKIQISTEEGKEKMAKDERESKKLMKVDAEQLIQKQMDNK